MRRFIPFVKSPPLMNVLRLQGVIATGGRGTLNDQALAGLIRRLAEEKDVNVAASGGCHVCDLYFI